MIPRKKKNPYKRSIRASHQRKLSNAAWVRKLDLLCRSVVFERDRHRCVAAGQGSLECSPRLDWSHVKSRRFRSTRWLPAGSLTLCVAHHRVWWHEHPDEAVEWWLNTYPERAETIRRAFAEKKSPDHADVEAMLMAVRGSSEGAESGVSPSPGGPLLGSPRFYPGETPHDEQLEGRTPRRLGL